MNLKSDQFSSLDEGIENADVDVQRLGKGASLFVDVYVVSHTPLYKESLSGNTGQRKTWRVLCVGRKRPHQRGVAVWW